MRPGNHHLLRLIAAALVALSAAAPVAQAAGGSPDDRPLSRATSLSPASVSPDDRPSYRGTSTALAATGIGPDDRPFARGVAGEPAVPPALTLVRPGGIDWADAVIGGAFGLALGLLGGAALIAAHQRRGTLRTT